MLPGREHRIFVGVDAATKHDNAAIGVVWKGDKLALACHRIWKPSPSEPLDLEATIEAYLKELHERFKVVEILADPYQMHRSITALQASRVPIREFPQTVGNTTLMGQTLFDLLTGRNLVLYASSDLRQQALSTVAVENPRGWRIAKEKASKKIDAIVALSMACVAAIEHGRPKTADEIPISIHEGKTATVYAVDGTIMDPEQQAFWQELTGQLTRSDA